MFNYYNDISFRNIIKDYGNNPYTDNIKELTKINKNYRTTLWTGDHLQITLMSIPINESIGLEIHPDVDQLIYIEEGEGVVMMGDEKNDLSYEKKVYDNYIVAVPSNTWHDVVNVGNKPLKLFSIYAPPNHPKGTINQTKADSEDY